MALDDWRLIFGVAATVIGGFWTVFVYFDKKRAARPQETGPTAVGGRAGATLPPAAVLVMLAGFALIGWSIFLGARPAPTAPTVTGTCGTAAGGDITGSTINNECR